MANQYRVWAVNGPVDHDARLPREQVFVSTGGSTGVVRPDSLRVRATPTPSSRVEILPGTFAVAATPGPGLGYTNAPGQSYSATVYSPETVEIRSTTSVGGRTDVVGLVIDDPEFEGTVEDTDYDTHQFWRPYVVENVSNSATLPEHFASLRRPFIPLAQVRIPASTATIQNSHIRDIRTLAAPKNKVEPVLQEVAPSGSAQFLTIPPTATSMTEYVRTPEMPVPAWATEAVIQLEQTAVIAGRTDHVAGRARAVLVSGSTRVNGGEIVFRHDAEWNWFQLPVLARLDVRALAGRTASVALEIRRTSGSDTMRVGARSAELFQYWLRGQVTFQETPTS